MRFKFRTLNFTVYVLFCFVWVYLSSEYSVSFLTEETVAACCLCETGQLLALISSIFSIVTVLGATKLKTKHNIQIGTFDIKLHDNYIVRYS